MNGKQIRHGDLNLENSVAGRANAKHKGARVELFRIEADSSEIVLTSQMKMHLRKPRREPLSWHLRPRIAGTAAQS